MEHLELAFEYLLRKDQMKWIIIYSDQVGFKNPMSWS